jgi:hypothetical protein
MWAARNSHGQVGYVPCADVELELDKLRDMMTMGVKRKSLAQPADAPNKQEPAAPPPPVETSEDVYETLVGVNSPAPAAYLGNAFGGGGGDGAAVDADEYDEMYVAMVSKDTKPKPKLSIYDGGHVGDSDSEPEDGHLSAGQSYVEMSLPGPSASGSVPAPPAARTSAYENNPVMPFQASGPRESSSLPPSAPVRPPATLPGSSLRPPAPLPQPTPRTATNLAGANSHPPLDDSPQHPAPPPPKPAAPLPVICDPVCRKPLSCTSLV